MMAVSSSYFQFSNGTTAPHTRQQQSVEEEVEEEKVFQKFNFLFEVCRSLTHPLPSTKFAYPRRERGGLKAEKSSAHRRREALKSTRNNERKITKKCKFDRVCCTNLTISLSRMGNGNKMKKERGKPKAAETNSKWIRKIFQFFTFPKKRKTNLICGEMSEISMREKIRNCAKLIHCLPIPPSRALSPIPTHGLNASSPSSKR